jgi:hypothetical protein
LVFPASNPKQNSHPYNTISFDSCNIGHYWMKKILIHLFDVVEAPKSPHPALKELMEFFNNVRSNLHVFEKHHLLIFFQQMS